jgi:hypothetical protein
LHLICNVQTKVGLAGTGIAEVGKAKNFWFQLLADGIEELQRNIAHIRREIRVQNAEMQSLIEADIDCTNAARLLMRMQADLVMFLEKRERLISRETT